MTEEKLLQCKLRYLFNIHRTIFTRSFIFVFVSKNKTIIEYVK